MKVSKCYLMLLFILSMSVSGYDISVAQQDTEFLDKLIPQMRVDMLWVYNFGYQKGVCDPQLAGINREDREYALLQLYPAFCAAGARDRKNGVPYDEQRIKSLIDRVIEDMKENINK